MPADLKFGICDQSWRVNRLVAKWSPKVEMTYTESSLQYVVAGEVQSRWELKRLH